MNGLMDEDLTQRLDRLAHRGVPGAGGAPSGDVMRGRSALRRRRTAIGASAVVATVAIGAGLSTLATPPSESPAPVSDPTPRPSVELTGPGKPGLTGGYPENQALGAPMAELLFPGGTSGAEWSQLVPTYDSDGRLVQASLFLDLDPDAPPPPEDGTAEGSFVFLEVAASPAYGNALACTEECTTYPLAGGEVEAGRHQSGPATEPPDYVWIYRQADGERVHLTMSRPPEDLNVSQGQIDALLASDDVDLVDSGSEAGRWHNDLRDIASEALDGRDSPWSLTLDWSSPDSGMLLGQLVPELEADPDSDRSQWRNELAMRWVGFALEGELVSDEDQGCDGFESCDTIEVDGETLIVRRLADQVWVEHDGPRVRSRMVLGDAEDGSTIPLDRVAPLLLDERWQDMPASQSRAR